MASPAKKPAKKAAKAAPKKTPAKAIKAVSAKAAKTPPKAAKAPKPAPVKAAAKAPAKPVPAKAAAKVAPAPVPAGKAVAAKAAPKAVAAKPPKPEPPKLPPKPKKSPFGPKELVTIREQLLAQRAMLETEAADLNAGTFDTSQSELSGEVAFDEEYADAGTFTFERERDLSLGNNIRDLVDRIDTALRKIDRGTYGICERCGEQIPRERMKALPYSVLCVRCKQIEERQR